MLRKGQGEVGELPVGDGLALAEEALDHGPGLAAKQLDQSQASIISIGQSETSMKGINN